MQALSKADILIYNSTGMERWVEQATQAAANPKLVIVEAAKGTNRISLTEADEIRAHGQYDPHTWLSLSCAQQEVKNIAEAEYNQKLQALLVAYQKKFSKLEQKNFVTGHAAFAYLCRDFGLQQQSIEDVFASGEPSAQNLAKLTAYCKEHNVKTIFVEEAVSPKTSETLAREVGATTQEIYTIECSNGEKTYLTRMEENLDAIYQSLKK
jgi:zinc transport system substrate-binding protein